MFDYQYRFGVIKYAQQWKISQGSIGFYLNKTDNTIYFSSQIGILSQKLIYLFGLNFKLKNGSMFISEIIRKQSTQKPYLSLNTQIESDGFFRQIVLNEGDYIKLGKVQLRVKQIRIGQSKKRILKRQIFYNRRIVHSHYIAEDQDYPCRICLNTCQQIKDNYIVKPCACSGTIGRIHTYCLKSWLKQAKKRSESPIILCDLCKEPIASKFEISGKLIDLRPIKKPKSGNMLLLQGYFQGTMNQILITAKQSSAILFGRSQQCQISIKEASISKIHAIVTFNRGQFCIQDNNSRYGTLLKKQSFKNYLDQEKNEIGIHIANSLIKLKLSNQY